ncbi:hypothetical protein Q8W71_17990 [Methylobacterium sp. NEAU 140]|uniref:hypothetical protein n=1 Tax=Methylobacterium sp. NEAU 140 TaxID=3064945 RepID=UPI002733589A|nr:hypothetical protein [Methylobacterium sp. NEAU 140]MDP4024518.1 hypothetical protein [Methylobacterium sp. NEAU 140]
MSNRFLPALFGCCLAAGAQGAEMPKSGETAYTTAYTAAAVTTMKLGDRTVATQDLTGITTNDEGGPMFNNMGTRCLGTRDATGSEVRSRGTCVDVDGDGDQVFSDYEADAKGGTHTFLGGTGKYKGITGTATYTFRPVKSPEGVNRMFIVPHKAKWQIP